jgi:hypothetical protein
MIVFLLRVILLLLAVVGIYGAFVIGFQKLPDPTKLDLIGYFTLLFGFWSALLWGVSVIGEGYWNSFFNFFAAGAGAIALGYSAQQAPFWLYVPSWVHALVRALQ